MFPGLSRVRSPSRVFTLFTVFGRMRPQPGLLLMSYTHPYIFYLPQYFFIGVCIGIMEEQRLVVLGSRELFTKVGQLHIHMIGKRGGKISYLYRQNKGRGIRASGRIRTFNLQHGPVFLPFWRRKRQLIPLSHRPLYM